MFLLASRGVDLVCLYYRVPMFAVCGNLIYLFYFNRFYLYNEILMLFGKGTTCIENTKKMGLFTVQLRNEICVSDF